MAKEEIIKVKFVGNYKNKKGYNVSGIANFPIDRVVDMPASKWNQVRHIEGMKFVSGKLPEVKKMVENQEVKKMTKKSGGE